MYKKSRIRETKHLSTDADSSTNAIGGWAKNTQKPDFYWKLADWSNDSIPSCQNQESDF